MKIEVIIPTKDRALSLQTALNSLTNQYRKPDFVTVVDGGSKDNTSEVVEGFFGTLDIRFLKTDPGLINQMNFAIAQAKGDVVVRTDDDVIFSPTWIEGIYETMLDPEVIGVTGPTVVPVEFQKNRDLFRLIFSNTFIAKCQRFLYQLLCDGNMKKVGYWSSCGVFSIGSNLATSIPTQKLVVDNLEACNFSVRLEDIRKIGGFDPSYIEIGEYHEPDACFKIQNLHPSKKIIFNPKVALNHCPSLKGFFNDRAVLAPRIHNYLHFVKTYKHKNLAPFSNTKFAIYLISVISFFTFSIRSRKQLQDLKMSLVEILNYLKEK